MGLLFVFILFLSPLWANDVEFDISSLALKKGVSKKSKEVCYIPKLTPQQIYIYDDIRKMHFSDTKKMRALLNRQKKAYETVLSNNKLQTTGFADEIARKYFRTHYNLSKDRTALFHAVLYKVLLKNQREALIKCL